MDSITLFLFRLMKKNEVEMDGSYPLSIYSPHNVEFKIIGLPERGIAIIK